MTNATDKAQVIVDAPDDGTMSIRFDLKSQPAINSSQLELFTPQTYTMVLDADGTDNGAFYLPTPDATGDLSWAWEVSLPQGVTAWISFAWSATAQDLSALLAAAASSTTPSDLLGIYLPLAGGTLTGLLNFSGTDHLGLQLLSMTTAQRDALTAVQGAMIYDTSLDRIVGYQEESGAWVTWLREEGGTMTGDVDYNGNEATNLIDRQKLLTADITGATYSVDPQAANLFILEIQSNTTLTVDATGAADGDSFSMRLTQDGTGNRTVTWSGVNWAGNTAPTLETSANDYNYFVFIYNAAESLWDGFSSGAFASLI